MTALRPDASTAESPRVRNLKRQIRGLRAEIDEARPKPTPVIEEDAPKAWDKTEPKFEDFQKDTAKYPDAYSAWLLAMADHNADKRQFETDQKNGVTAKARASQEADQAVKQQFTEKRVVFAKSHPDYDAKWNAAIKAGYDIPAVVTKVVLTDDNNGPRRLCIVCSTVRPKWTASWTSMGIRPSPMDSRRVCAAVFESSMRVSRPARPERPRRQRETGRLPRPLRCGRRPSRPAMSRLMMSARRSRITSRTTIRAAVTVVTKVSSRFR